MELPKGLREFEASLDDLEYAPDLLPRLLDLPESNLRDRLAVFTRAMLDVDRAERAAHAARLVARKAAQDMWLAAKANWTVAELQEATGYDHE